MTIFRQAVSVCAVALMLAGCVATSSEIVDLGSNTKGYRVYCGGTIYSDADDCHSRAEYLCGDLGYSVLKEASMPYTHTLPLWDNSTHYIIVQCNAP